MKDRKKIGRPTKPESEKRTFKQNFRLNKDEYKLFNTVPGNGPTSKWCYLLKFWSERKLKD